MKQALVEKTLKVIDEISKMEFVKPYFLVGSTALSLQIKHRLSEDFSAKEIEKFMIERCSDVFCSQREIQGQELHQ